MSWRRKCLRMPFLDYSGRKQGVSELGVGLVVGLGMGLRLGLGLELEGIIDLMNFTNGDTTTVGRATSHL